MMPVVIVCDDAHHRWQEFADLFAWVYLLATASTTLGARNEGFNWAQRRLKTVFS